MTQTKKEAAGRLLAGGTAPSAVAATFGVSRSTLYRWVPGAKSNP